jgi:Lipopolysaccharide-assembly
MGSAAPGYEWNSLYRTDVRTVAVPIFTNKTFQRGVEFHLTKAIVSNLEAQTPYKVVPRDRADTLLEGEITRIRARTLSEDRRAAIPQEQLLLMTVNFTWKDLRTGKVLAQQRNYEQVSHWYATLGEGAFVAEQQNVERLAQAIVHELQAQW